MSDRPHPTTVSTHVLDTSAGRPAAGVTVTLEVRDGRGDGWRAHSASATDADGRCRDLAPLPAGTEQARLTFEVAPYLGGAHGEPGRDQGSFFPEVTVAVAVTPGAHYHVPLLLNPYGYTVYRGS